MKYGIAVDAENREQVGKLTCPFVLTFGYLGPVSATYLRLQVPTTVGSIVDDQKTRPKLEPQPSLFLRWGQGRVCDSVAEILVVDEVGKQFHRGVIRTAEQPGNIALRQERLTSRVMEPGNFQGYLPCIAYTCMSSRLGG